MTHDRLSLLFHLIIFIFVSFRTFLQVVVLVDFLLFFVRRSPESVEDLSHTPAVALASLGINIRTVGHDRRCWYVGSTT